MKDEEANICKVFVERKNMGGVQGGGYFSCLVESTGSMPKTLRRRHLGHGDAARERVVGWHGVSPEMKMPETRAGRRGSQADVSSMRDCGN